MSIQNSQTGEFRGIAERGWIGDFADPYALLTPLFVGPVWKDPQYEAALLRANTILDHPTRLATLADAEKQLLRAMPIIPIGFYQLPYLQKPYIRGLSPTPLKEILFRYAWIDTKWRPPG